MTDSNSKISYTSITEISNPSCYLETGVQASTVKIITHFYIIHIHTRFGTQDKSASLIILYISCALVGEHSSQFFCNIIFVYLDYSASDWSF